MRIYVLMWVLAAVGGMSLGVQAERRWINPAPTSCALPDNRYVKASDMDSVIAFWMTEVHELRQICRGIR